jgi:capsid protein
MLTWSWLWEPLAAYWARKRLERLQYTAAARLFAETYAGRPPDDDPDAARWRLLGQGDKELGATAHATLRDQARHLADHNPHARNILILHRDYVVGTGMRHEVEPQPGVAAAAAAVHRATALWRAFLDANHWDAGQRKDWEFALRTWRDGECFLRLYRQPAWPPRALFIDPEHITPDPRTGTPEHGIATVPGNPEEAAEYCFVHGQQVERIPAARMLHAKIGVDANVKRGVSLFLPVLDVLKRYQSWLDVELIHRKVASSVVLVRKHHGNHPGGVAGFADAVQSASPGGGTGRRLTLQPGTIIDAQGFDLQFLSPNSHFADASGLGRTVLLAIAAGTGLPEFMLAADASNANYASTLVAEGPAVRHFAAWQAFFVGHWQRLFDRVLGEAVRLGELTAAERRAVRLHLTPPPLAVRNRHHEALADAVYFRHGALSRRELSRRERVDPDLMARERAAELATARTEEPDHA